MEREFLRLKDKLIEVALINAVTQLADAEPEKPTVHFDRVAMREYRE